MKTHRVKVIIFSKQLKEKKSTNLEIYIDDNNEYSSNNKDVRIFHIGNNSQSIPVFKELIASKVKNNIVVLHDIYLGDLFAKLLDNENQIEREETYRRILGTSDYLLFLLHNKRRNESNKEFRAKISVKFLNYFIPEGTILIHGEDKTYENHLTNYFEPHKLHRIDLPIGYHEIQQNLELEKTYDIIISGTSSPSKKTDYISHQIEKLCKESEIKILFLGSVSKQIQTEHPNLSNTKMVDFIETCTEEEWDHYHSRSKLGIRLGVGEQGEKSGSVRDYLVYGMQVLTDEETKSFKELPNFIYFDGKTPLWSQIKMALEKRTEKINKSLLNNVKDYYEKILTTINHENEFNSEKNPTAEILVDKSQTFPTLNMKIARILMQKFEVIYVIRRNSEIWEINLREILKKSPKFYDLNNEFILETNEIAISKHIDFIPEECFFSKIHNSDKVAIVVESLTNLVWIKGYNSCHQILIGKKRNGISLFIKKEEEDISALEKIPDFIAITKSLMNFSPWQNIELRNQKFEPNQKMFFISDMYQINDNHELEEKSRIKHSDYKDFKTIENITYESDSMIIKHVPYSNFRSINQLFSEYKNWTELSTMKSILEDYQPKPELSFNPWGACLNRQKIPGRSLLEIQIGQDKRFFMQLVFEEARRFGNNLFFPNDLRPWNIIIDNKRARFIDFINDIRKDEDADGIPQILALHLTLEYIKNDTIKIHEKIAEIREVLGSHGIDSKHELDLLFAKSWGNLDLYESLLLDEIEVSDLIAFVLRTSKND